MCGIAGIVSARGPASAKEIGNMTSIVAYRGPDDFGYLGYSRATGKARFSKDTAELEPGGGESYDVLLGHRRLSILDLSENGRCPMQSADGRLWITYNGEVYNYLELRSELTALGHRFSTGTDTEVILAAYREWGTDCLRRFNGMWAFALLDTDKSILVCARDRLGVKPFYYHRDRTAFSFGSEIKQLLTLPRLTREPHAGVLFDFLVFSAFGCNSENTFYRDVVDLRGGHYLVVPLDAMDTWIPTPVRWWDIDLRHKLEGWTDQQYADRYLELFEDAVRLRLRSDVPLGTCLSGGLDSSGIVCAVDRILHRAGVQGLQKTFTSVSSNPAFDERAYAQMVIDATRVAPSFVEPNVERLLSDLDRLLWHQDEPFISTSIFAGWCVYGLAREQGVTVTLDGQGPDEMLGGYIPAMFPSLLVENLLERNLAEAVRNSRGLHDSLGVSYPTIGRMILHEAGRGWLPRGLMPSIRSARKLLSRDFIQQGVAHSPFLRRMKTLPAWQVEAGGTAFDQKLYQATFHDSLPGILRQVDRNSMAFSVESRLPFLDYRLVEYTFSLPSRQKIRDGVSKQVYRRALSGRMPDAIRDRRTKLGFVTAEGDWIRGPGKNAFADAFNRIPDYAPYRRSALREKFQRFIDGRSAYDPMLWKVFNIEHLRAMESFYLPVEWRSGLGVNWQERRAVASGSRKVRLLHVSFGTVQALQYAVAIAELMDDVHFVDLSGTSDLTVLRKAGIIVHDVAEGGDEFAASARLQRLLPQIKPDVICCYYGLGDHFRNAIAYNGCPVALVAMGTDVLRRTGDVPRSWFVRMLSRMGQRRVAFISARSRVLADKIRRDGITCPVDINYWGCNLQEFQPASRSEARRRLNLPEDVKIVLSPRAQVPRMNIHLVVEAFAAVARRWPDAVLVLLGASDPAYKHLLMQVVDRLGISARVHDVGSVDQRLMPDYCNASDLVVSVAGSDGFPGSILEAMACGVPVVAGDIPQITELLTDGVNARVCALDAAAISAAMTAVLADPGGAASLSAAGRATAHAVGDIEKNARRWVRTLRKLAILQHCSSPLSIARYRVALYTYRALRAVRRTAGLALGFKAAIGAPEIDSNRRR